MGLSRGSIEVQLNIQSKLMNRRQRVYLIVISMLQSFLLWLYALLGRLVVLGRLVDGVRVRHAENSGPAFLLEYVSKILMF